MNSCSICSSPLRHDDADLRVRISDLSSPVPACPPCYERVNGPDRQDEGERCASCRIEILDGMFRASLNGMDGVLCCACLHVVRD